MTFVELEKNQAEKDFFLNAFPIAFPMNTNTPPEADGESNTQPARGREPAAAGDVSPNFWRGPPLTITQERNT